MTRQRSTIKRRVWVGLLAGLAAVGAWGWWLQSRPALLAEGTRPEQPFVQLAGAGSASGSTILQERAGRLEDAGKDLRQRLYQRRGIIIPHARRQCRQHQIGDDRRILEIRHHQLTQRHLVQMMRPVPEAGSLYVSRFQIETSLQSSAARGGAFQ